MFLARRILLDQQDLLSIECLYLAISQVVVGFQKQIKNLWTPFTGRKLAFCSRLHSGSKRILNYQNNIHVKHDSVSILSSLLHQGKYTEFIGHIFLTEIQLDNYHRKHILGMSWRLNWKAISTLHTNHLCPTNDQSFYNEKQHKDN